MSNIAALRPPVFALVYSPPGHGKSFLAADAPKDMIVLSGDGYGKMRPYLKRGVPLPLAEGEFGQGVIEIKSRKNPERTIIQLELFDDIFGTQSGLYVPQGYEQFKKRLAVVAAEIIDGRWKTLVVDSVSSFWLMCRKLHQYRLLKNGVNKDWAMGTTDMLEELLCGQLKGLSRYCNVIVLAHVDKDKDEVLGHIVGTPSAPGRLQAKDGLSAVFPEVYRAHAAPSEDGKGLDFWLQTRPDARYAAHSQFLEAPNPCGMKWNTLWTNFDAEMLENAEVAA